jgi:hypothetical protein
MMQWIKFMENEAGLPQGGTAHCPDPDTATFRLAPDRQPQFVFPLCGDTMNKYGLKGEDIEADCSHLREKAKNPDVVSAVTYGSVCEIKILVSNLEFSGKDPGFFCCHNPNDPPDATAIIDIYLNTTFEFEPKDSEGRSVPRRGYDVLWTLGGMEGCRRHPDVPHPVGGGMQEYIHRHPEAGERRLYGWLRNEWGFLKGATTVLAHDCIVLPEDEKN